jgi:hypothetical protein
LRNFISKEIKYLRNHITWEKAHFI